MSKQKIILEERAENLTPEQLKKEKKYIKGNDAYSTFLNHLFGSEYELRDITEVHPKQSSQSEYENNVKYLAEVENLKNGDTFTLESSVLHKGKLDDRKWEQKKKLEKRSFKLDVENKLYDLSDYEGEKEIKFLVGPKGMGKTYSLMQALNTGLKINKNYIPLVLQYKNNESIALMKMTNILEKEEWGDRLDKIRDARKNGLDGMFEKADMIIIDDLHYMCEDVLYGNMNVDELVGLLESVKKYSEENKRIVLVSENPLNYYAEMIQDSRLNKLLPYFGFRDNNRVEESNIEQNVSSMSYMEIINVIPESVQKNIEEMGVKLEGEKYEVNEKILSKIWEKTNNPRKYIKEVNEKIMNDYKENLDNYSKDELSQVAMILSDNYSNYFETNNPPNMEIKQKTFIEAAKKELEFAYHIIEDKIREDVIGPHENILIYKENLWFSLLPSTEQTKVNKLLKYFNKKPTSLNKLLKNIYEVETNQIKIFDQMEKDNIIVPYRTSNKESTLEVMRLVDANLTKYGKSIQNMIINQVEL